MNKLAVVFALVTLASTGCASLGTNRPNTGGGQITKTAPAEETKTTDVTSGMGERADLGER
jgi:hypothetical protein